jgi:hypothetical protein
MALGTFKSTLQTLRAMINEGNADPVANLRSTVVTRGGCTEKGVNKILTPDQLTSRKFMEEEVVMPILNVANNFPRIATESIRKSLRA